MKLGRFVAKRDVWSLNDYISSPPFFSTTHLQLHIAVLKKISVIYNYVIIIFFVKVSIRGNWILHYFFF